MSRPGNINVLQWNREFLPWAHRVELEVHCDDEKREVLGWSAPVSWSLFVTSLLDWTCWRQILRCRCWRRIATRTGGKPDNKRYEFFRFAYYYCLLHFGQPWFFDRWPTRRNIRGLRRVFQAIEQQAFLRVIAVTNRFRSWTKTCTSSFVCTSPLAVTTTVGSWIFAKYPVRLSLNLFFCSACALMLLNRLRILALLEILKWAPALSWLP